MRDYENYARLILVYASWLPSRVHVQIELLNPYAVYMYKHV